MLPKGWVEAKIADVTASLRTGPFGSAVHKRDYVADGVPLINPMHIRGGQIQPSRDVGVRWSKSEELAEFRLSPGDVILGRRGEMGRCAVVNARESGWLIGTGSMALTPTRAVNSTYLQRYLTTPHVIETLSSGAVGTTMVNLNQSILARLTIDLPPVAEQRRIVAKLDALTTRIARARAELDRVPALARRLRETALLGAFRGTLTAPWREGGTEKCQTDEELDAAFSNVNGSRRKAPVSGIEWKPDLALPPGWRWVSVDRVLAKAQYGTSAKTTDAGEGVPVLRMGNIQRGEIDWTTLKFLPQEHSEFPDLLLQPGDILFNRTNSFELVGKSAVFRGAEKPVSFASYLIRLRCAGFLPDLLAHYLNSPLGRAWVDRVASQQVGQANVNGSKLRSLGIPLPPPDEQTEISRILRSLFARADRIEAEAARARVLLDRLEAAILAKAFRGELVPQDPNDEPASVLLDRIRAERAAAPKPKRGRGRKQMGRAATS